MTDSPVQAWVWGARCPKLAVVASVPGLALTEVVAVFVHVTGPTVLAWVCRTRRHLAIVAGVSGLALAEVVTVLVYVTGPTVLAWV